MHKVFITLLALVAAFTVSCKTVPIDQALREERKNEEALRRGPVGTEEQPFLISPFKKYELVMAAGECRVFQVKVPKRWYWKAYVTVATLRADGTSKFSARLLPKDSRWVRMAPFEVEKEFKLSGVTSNQVVLAVANPAYDRVGMLVLCQEGPPLTVTLESEVSPWDSAIFLPPLNGGLKGN